MHFKDFRPDLNFKYPFEDFKADIKGVEDAINNKTFGKGNNLKVEMEDGEIREYGFNTNHPLFQQTEYFHKKYGEEEGTRRNLKFHCIFSFVFGNINLLVQNKLAVFLNGNPVFRSDFDDFLKYLLNFRVNPKDNEIPKKAIKGFLLWKQGN